jgi:acetyltransferase-like isoleucine patch superfamily enzyme
MKNINEIGKNNIVEVPDNFSCNFKIRGNNNKVRIEDGSLDSSLVLDIHGNDNVISIGRGHVMRGLKINVGTSSPANHVNCSIGRWFSIEPNGKFLLHNPGNRLVIGDSCMFSNNITVRLGELPHLLFDSITGEYFDISDGVYFGDHCWIGENVYVTKSAGIKNNVIVGACSVLTRKFDQSNIVVAGNPAKCVRENVTWIRNKNILKEGSLEYISYYNHQKKFTND